MPAVTLRPVEDADLAAFFEWQRDGESVRMAAVSPREEAEFYQHWARNRVAENGVLRTIVADGEVAGYIVSWPAGDRRLVGYWLGKPFWGKGLASDALAQFTGVDRRRPLHAIVAEHNVASRRVLEKTGFRVVGEDTVDDGPGGVPFKELHLVLDAAAE